MVSVAVTGVTTVSVVVTGICTVSVAVPWAVLVQFC